MNTTKKLFAGMMIGVLAAVSFIPPTFSWYSHNQSAEGNNIRYVDNLDVSIKSAESEVTMQTFQCDANGVVTAGASPLTGGVSVNPKSTLYYKTTLENTGENDVMVDLETADLPNNADFLLGTFEPTLNEKAYASRPVRTKVSHDKVRVYFKTNTTHASYWGTYDPDNFYPAKPVDSNNGTKNDFNIAYVVGTTTTLDKMTQCTTTDPVNDGEGNRTDVYYYDLPSNASSFFFFNHWYLCSSSNTEWNRTIDITDLSAGKLYYLTGGSVDGKWKEYNVRSVDNTLVAVNSYYKSVRMSMGTGVSADISLKKDGDGDDFIPDYFGSTVSYSSDKPAVASVNKDGVITPKGYTTEDDEDHPVTITTTITGRYGDTETVTTSVSIPANIAQVPIIKNVRVPHGKTVDVYWYARNNSAPAENQQDNKVMTTSSLYITI